MWCPDRENSTNVIYPLIWRMVWEELLLQLSLILTYSLPQVAWTSWGEGGKSASYLSAPSPFPTPTVSMVEPAVLAAKENKAFSYLEGIPLWTSKVYSKQWSWKSFANKRSEDFFIVENIRLPTGRGCFQLTNNTTLACKYTLFWAELIFAEILHGPSDVTLINPPSSYFIITLIIGSSKKNKFKQ